MNKLMIAAAIICAAAVSQAAAISWSTSDVFKGVTPASVIDNGSYAGGGSNLKSNGTIAYALTLFQGGESVGTWTGTAVNIAGSKKVSQTINLGDEFVAGNYDWKIVLTGVQTDLQGKTSDAYDYSAAKIEATLTGEKLGIVASGQSTLSTASPANWTVSGITSKGPGPEPTPEPTSGLLLLLGVAGLALRRKQK